MPEIVVDGQPLHYEDEGTGPPVVMVAGTGSRGRVWHLHQVPALVSAGYRVITFDNRAGGPGGRFGVASLVSDTAALIERLELGQSRAVGFSLGARVVAELLVERPELVERAVLLATRGRVDHWTKAMLLAERTGTTTTPEFGVVVRAMQYLSPTTLRDDRATRDWLELFELTSATALPGLHEQVALDELLADRLTAYSAIEAACLVVGFGDDLVTPPQLTREVARAIPRARYHEVADCGHYGYLERPGEVNKLIVDFLGVSSRD
ncbi:alpha/beta fold hydrolase [Saccharomonospora piscinae]|uniref:alpha/beta fold hydrolase n=1 Tax=Saccharomonospora piscinae TaxID=687388 RepID=UPI0004659EED|nr:alpha/beta hydrolase [Saccharomonospora piscinae]